MFNRPPPMVWVLDPNNLAQTELNLFYCLFFSTIHTTKHFTKKTFTHLKELIDKGVDINHFDPSEQCKVIDWARIQNEEQKINHDTNNQAEALINFEDLIDFLDNPEAFMLILHTQDQPNELIDIDTQALTQQLQLPPQPITITNEQPQIKIYQSHKRDSDCCFMSCWGDRSKV